MLSTQIEELDITKIVFVFGSNLAGRHGKGAALTARTFFGAEMKNGIGLQNSSYAIPTKDEKLQPLTLKQIQYNIEQFLDFAGQHANRHFFVTKIGCGLAGYSETQIISVLEEIIDPYLKNCITNITLPTEWQIKLGLIDSNPYTIIAGSRTITNINKITPHLSKINCYKIISGCAAGVDQLGILWADKHHVPLIKIPAPWKHFNNNKQTGLMRNWIMLNMATESIIFWDGKSTGAKHMYDISSQTLLPTNLIRISDVI